MEFNSIDSLRVLLSTCLGGALALLGTLLANFLQYRSEKRSRLREFATQRLVEVRRYIQACLEFADIAYRPRRQGPNVFQPEHTQQWVAEMAEELKQWRSFPVKGSARALYTSDEKLIKLLRELDSLTFLFYLNAKLAYKEGKMADIDDKFEELCSIASRASNVVDVLIKLA